MIIKNGQVYTEEFKFEEKNISIVGDIIANSTDSQEVFDASGCYVIPGLIDVHIHGAMGKDFCDGDDAALDTISDYLGSKGITAFTPASMTLPEETLRKIFTNSDNYKYKKGAIFSGINMEGPYISMEKKGAQNGAYIVKSDVDMFNRLYSASGDNIKQVAIAPETDGAIDFIKKTKSKTVLSVAHTAANYDKAMEAFEAGASNVTHLYNAMPIFTHRSPGVIGAAFDSDTMVELICDGVHIVPSVIRATFKMFGDDRIILVSDSMMACGMANGQYSLGGLDVTVEGSKAMLTDGGSLAGSVTSVMDCMINAIKFGIPIESAVRCGTYNPAKLIKCLDTMGTLANGKLANIVILDKQFNVKAVFIKGICQYQY